MNKRQHYLASTLDSDRINCGKLEAANLDYKIVQSGFGFLDLVDATRICARGPYVT
jgi:hypothetical protein